MSQLSKLLTKETVRLKQPISNWKEAIHLAGKLLVDSGDIDPRYIDEAIQVATDVGPYFVVRPSVAIAHGRPSPLVHRISLSMVTLNPAIEFGHEDNDPVSILFLLAAIDNYSHIDVLEDLARILSNDDLVSLLINIENPDELRDFFIHLNS